MRRRRIKMKKMFVRIMLLCLLLDAALGQTCSTEGSSYTWSETASATTRTITTK